MITQVTWIVFQTVVGCAETMAAFSKAFAESQGMSIPMTLVTRALVSEAATTYSTAHNSGTKRRATEKVEEKILVEEGLEEHKGTFSSKRRTELWSAFADREGETPSFSQKPHEKTFAYMAKHLSGGNCRFPRIYTAQTNEARCLTETSEEAVTANEAAFFRKLRCIILTTCATTQLMMKDGRKLIQKLESKLGDIPGITLYQAYHMAYDFHK